MGDELIVNFTKPLVGSYETAGSVVPAESQKVIFNFGDKQEAVTDKNTSNPPNYSPKSFDVFPKGNKDNAYDEYQDVKTRVENSFLEWNASHDEQIVVDYSEFPNPANYVMKKNPNKNQDGFDMYLKALRSWETRQMKKIEVAQKLEEQRAQQTLEHVLKLIDSMFTEQEKINKGINNLVEQYKNGNITLKELKTQLDEISRNQDNISNKVDEVNQNVRDIDTNVNELSDKVDKVGGKVDKVKTTVGNIRGTQVSDDREARKKETLKNEIFKAMHNDLNQVKVIIREVVRKFGGRYDRYTHSDLQEATILEIVNTMSLNELKAIRNRIPYDLLVDD